METIRSVMEWVAFVLDTLAIALIVVSVVVAAFQSGLLRGLFRGHSSEVLARYRARMISGVLAGLDLLVASDVIKTVVLETTLHNVGALGLLVFIRIALTWSLVVETEGRWPWQPRSAGGEGDVGE